MGQGALVSEQIEAGARFLREFDKYAPVKVAFWIKETEVGRWYLYVTSEKITAEDVYSAYGEVVRLARVMQDPWFDMFQVKVVEADHPKAKAAAELQRRYPRRVPLRFQDEIFGGVHVEEGYIYPPLTPAPAQEGRSTKEPGSRQAARDS
ncbi:MAG TPA: hypothetical protein VEL76_26060 [Gemmataceae bacterium]|nr:hypothetical protein [Gemmataceae bacterium]